eukprot:57433_1
MSKDPKDPFNRNGGWDPFNDPFFKQFDNIQQHMDNIFRDFFDHGRQSLFIEHEPDDPNNSNFNSNPQSPDLSQINPNVEPPKNNKNSNNDYHAVPHNNSAP